MREKHSVFNVHGVHTIVMGHVIRKGGGRSLLVLFAEWIFAPVAFMRHPSNSPYIWSNITSANAATMTTLLNVMSASHFVQSYRQYLREMLQIQEGDQILDIGCGLGEEVLELTNLVGPAGRVVGIDKSEALLNEAHKKAQGFTNVEFIRNDAHSLSFADATFDVCRAERVFQHLEDPQHALTEMIRVARPGARLLVIDPDWDTFIIDAENRTLTRKLVHFFCDQVRNGWMGRQLPGLFRKAGIKDITIVPETTTLVDSARIDQIRSSLRGVQDAGIVSEQEASEWLSALERIIQAGNFFAAVTVFAVYGRKP